MSQEVSKIVSIWLFHPLVKRVISYLWFKENLNHYHLIEPSKGSVQVSEDHCSKHYFQQKSPPCCETLHPSCLQELRRLIKDYRPLV